MDEKKYYGICWQNIIFSVLYFRSKAVILYCFSRKGTLLANNAFALAAALLMGLSSPTGVFELLVIGRFLTGMNAGK